ncbi:hypothetical protein FSW04_10165 [Baekduia soli]|uniref:ABM domain-containing protein n=1 Tax=Baekduia soli TaxID=496014 RepID=A0A5B8U4K2_9ACTN|nr:hypothetical protein [Baekduia soli]QEC47897.1 hypothetical protein FSW04_10165 [Baekduia soli]
MHAVIVDVSIKDADEARSELRERTVPGVAQAPGFVAGFWIQRGEGHGHSVVVFESEEAANSMAGIVRSVAPKAVTIESVGVGEVVAHA